MNNCEHIEDLFSDRFDGELTASDQDTFDKHLAACTRCNNNWLEFQEAVSILGTSGGRETSPELHAATLAAVDAAMVPAREASRAKPLLLAAFLGAVAALLLAWLVVGIFANGIFANNTFDITIDSDVVALQPGETHSQNGLLLSRSNSGQLTVSAEAAEPEVIEVPVEVRVEVPVERIVKVPVEVRVEVPVEVIVKEPVYVEVERGPWFTVDTSSLAAALRDAGTHLGSGMEALAATRRAAPENTPQNTAESPRAPMRSPVAKTARPPRQPSRIAGAALRVHRTDGRIQLQTSGTLEELVPTLLAQLETPDEELCSMIQRRLAAIHEEAAQDPNIREALADMPTGRPVPTQQRSLFGDPRQPERTPAPAVAWAEWWDANSELLTQVASL